ncbi:MAG: polymer-forming cytoskeletal protein, partial [Dysgonamonadaceae bacterium]|nr:polymer-forming cytoskeletal protein [Dysgonamonadaceae bacterium]
MSKTKETYSQGIAHNAISQGTTVKGNIYSDGDFRVDGRVEGNIESDGKVVVGPTGEMSGTILCQSLEIMGTVTGNIHTKDNVSLKRSSVYTGDM